MSTQLQLEIRDSVALVTLDRPPANAMNLDMISGLARILPRLRESDVAAVVLRGQGRFFSAGLDLFEIFEYDDATATTFAAVFDEAMRGWFALDVPVVAALCGHAVAGGLVLAATADFRIGAEGSGRVGLTEILVGVPFPVSALEPVRFSFPAPLLPELLYRGTTWPMADAAARGLVDRVVPADRLDDEAFALARELASRGRPGFYGTKRNLRAPYLARVHSPPGQDPAWQLWRHPEVRAQMAAYRERALRRG